MPSNPVVFHRLAIAEARRSYRWYERRSRQSAHRFQIEFDRIIALIQSAPQQFAHHLVGTRAALLRRFPYAVVFEELPAVTAVLAVAHAARRPGYWKGRRRRP